jgi:hypothetical protein
MQLPTRLSTTLGVLALLSSAALAGSLDAVTSQDAAAGLRGAIAQGVNKAIGMLGAPNGFLANARYTIPLPPALERAEQALRLVGMSGEADQLKTAMNHAAEMAVADARPVFTQAVRRMTIRDAKGILTGGDDAATQYFRQATSATLASRFKPIVARETAKVRLGSLYDEYAGKASRLGLLKSEDANLDDYVTHRALDSLFGAIGEEERAIRKDPAGQASALVRKVFSAL